MGGKKSAFSGIYPAAASFILGGMKVYDTAIKCAVNEDLKEEWEKYRQETEHHVQVLHDVFSQMQLDPDEQSPGRKIVHDIGAGLVVAMQMALKAAYAEIEDQEDEHLYHTKGWCRGLWMESLGMKAVLPPPEEKKHVVKTAIGAARAEQERTKMR